MSLLDPKLEVSKALHRQIAEHIRQLISSGELAVQTRLPSTEVLAKSWKTSTKTVQASLTLLVKEGLLNRTPNLGTFVRKPETSLKTLGIYYPNLDALRRSPFQQALRSEIQALLSAQDIECSTWIDERSSSTRHTAWDQAVKVLETRQVQGLILPMAGLPEVMRAKKLPVPFVCLTPAKIHQRVDLDFNHFVELSLKALRKQGCKTVALISPIPKSFVRRFTLMADEFGLQTRESWIPTVSEDLSMESLEKEAYDCFQKLWARNPRPEGLIVHPDVPTVRGVVTAILQGGVDIPKDLKLVLHRNEGLEIFVPFPATFVSSSVREMAAAFLRQILKQFKGEACQPIHLKYKLGKEV